MTGVFELDRNLELNTDTKASGARRLPRNRQIVEWVLEVREGSRSRSAARNGNGRELEVRHEVTRVFDKALNCRTEGWTFVDRGGRWSIVLVGNTSCAGRGTNQGSRPINHGILIEQVQ